MTTISEIVSVAILNKIAGRIVRSARNFARGKGRGGRVERSIKIGLPKVTQSQSQINIILDTKIAPEAPAFEWGSGLHSTKRFGGYVVISAKNKPFLVFEGTNQWAGQIIKTPVVLHPGIKPQPFLEPAKKLTREQNLADIRNEVSKNMRLIVKGMAKKV